MTSVLLALTGLADEPELVRAASTVGLTVTRRCVDAVDLLAAAATDQTSAVVVASGLPRLGPDLLARLGDRPIIGVAADSLGRERLIRLGIDPVVDVAPSAQTTMQQVSDICRARTPLTAPPPQHQDPRITAVANDVEPTVPLGVEPERPQPIVPSSTPVADGRVIAVWGPPGSPGRTTVATGLAEVLAHQGYRVALVDADTYAPSIAASLGLVEPASGLIAACRHAEAGTLTAAGLVSLTMPIGSPVDVPRAKRGRRAGQWRVLGGIERANRWSDLRSGALDRLWSVARTAFDITVVDVGFCLEVDQSPGAWGRQRNAAALSAVAHADHLVAVADGSALGALRLLAGWGDLGDDSARPATTVVCNRAGRRVGQWRSVVEEGIGRVRVHTVPDEPQAVQAAWDRGLGLGESARGSRVLRALDALAADFMGGARAPRVPVSAA